MSDEAISARWVKVLDESSCMVCSGPDEIIRTAQVLVIEAAGRSLITQLRLCRPCAGKLAMVLRKALGP